MYIRSTIVNYIQSSVTSDFPVAMMVVAARYGATRGWGVEAILGNTPRGSSTPTIHHGTTVVRAKTTNAGDPGGSKEGKVKAST
jgi:hypothetical protein